METYDPHKSTTEIRQASPRLDNFWVLIVSMVGIVAIFGVVFLVFTMGNTPSSVISP